MTDANRPPGEILGGTPSSDGLAKLIAEARYQLAEIEKQTRALNAQATTYRRIIEEGERGLGATTGAAIPADSAIVMEPAGRGGPPDPAVLLPERSSASPSGTAPFGASFDRYGKIALPVIETALRERGPQTVDNLYKLLPAELRYELEHANSTYDPVYRIRRLLRKSARFIVAKEGTVSLSPVALAYDTGNATRILRVIRDQHSAPVGFEIDAGDGVTVMKLDDVRTAIRAGGMFRLPDIRGRNSRLTLFDGKLRSEHNHVHNRDFAALGSVSKDDIDPALQALL